MVCDCGTPWTFLLPFFEKIIYEVSGKIWRKAQVSTLFKKHNKGDSFNFTRLHTMQKKLIQQIYGPRLLKRFQ